ncbi:hypothetical protein [Streptomyces sp. NPDC015125]|uniref:hypothetical protein n=1 Tax=Streptomyces sp. NPDC015125 TaxID=3364938 RepID=UPI0036F8752F
MSDSLPELMTRAAGLLDAIGDAQPLTVDLKVRNPGITLRPSFPGPINTQRGMIERVAHVLGSQATVKPVTDRIYTYSVQGELGGTRVIAITLTPLRAESGAAMRSTTTAKTANVLRDLLPWADSLETAELYQLSVADMKTDHEVSAAIARSDAPSKAAVRLVGNLPNQVDVRWYGASGTALLPTGHTLHIYDVG